MDGFGRHAAGWMLIALIPVWVAVLAHGGFTYSGPWRWAAEWERGAFGVFYAGYTTQAFLVLGVGGAGMLYGTARALMPQMPLPSLRELGDRMREAGSPSVLAGLAALLLLAGAGAGAIGYAASRQPIVLEAVDLSLGGKAVTRHIRLSGVAQPGAMIVHEETDRGGRRTREEFIPITAPSWRRGDAVDIVLHVDRNAVTISTQPFAIVQEGTLFADDLPGSIRSAFDRRGVRLSEPVLVLDPRIDADTRFYFGLSLAGFLGGVGALVMALVTAAKSRAGR